MNKDNNIYLAITGYYGTGSSAILDLLKEYEGVNIANPTPGDYEHIIFYADGGLIDLGSILLNDCSPYNSDAAINRFVHCVKRLNHNDFGWYGAYQKYYGNALLDISNDFINSISKKNTRRNTNHALRVKFSILKVLLQIVAKIIYGRKIAKLGRVYIYDRDPCFFAMPTVEEFYNAARIFTTKYMSMCCSEIAQVNVFDHLLWPQHHKLIKHYFGNNFKMIIVNRDPRDVFILNKYYWHVPPNAVTKPVFPVDPYDFAEEWKRTVVTSMTNDPSLLFINFEDLIYNYERTTQRIESFCNLDSQTHLNMRQTFDPLKSIENTQVFYVENKWQKEAEILNNLLPAYCYNFPYQRTPDKTKWFDCIELFPNKSNRGK